MAVRKKITDEQLSDAVKYSESVFGVMRSRGLKLSGGSHSNLSKRIKSLNLDTTHFTGQRWNAGKTFECLQKSPESILVLRQEGIRAKAYHLRRALIACGVKYQCIKCGQDPEWQGNPLTLDVDHINQNWLDDRLENLRFLCPNCHSQYSRNLLH